MFDRGWTDGLPVVPPTEARVLRMLDGTDPRAGRDRRGRAARPRRVHGREGRRQRGDWPGASPSTCRSCSPRSRPRAPTTFNIHGLLATTYFGRTGRDRERSDPHAHRHEHGVNVLGQGNRANATIGRALQLVIRNVGGGRPGGVDRATLGNPGKLTFCFAEDEEGSPWEPLHVERGFAPGVSHGDAVRRRGAARHRRSAVARSRVARPVVRRRACARSPHPKLPIGFDAVLVVVARARVACSAEAGWTKARLRERAARLLTLLDGEDIVRGADGIAEGLPEWARRRAAAEVPPRRPADRARRRRCRPVLDDHRRLGQR